MHSLTHDFVVRLWSTIAIELPNISHLLNDAEVKVSDEQLIVIFACLRDGFAARIHEVTRAIELADVPRRFSADTIDATHVVAVGNCMRRLLDLPQILRKTRDRR